MRPLGLRLQMPLGRENMDVSGYNGLVCKRGQSQACVFVCVCLFTQMQCPHRPLCDVQSKRAVQKAPTMPKQMNGADLK